MKQVATGMAAALLMWAGLGAAQPSASDAAAKREKMLARARAAELPGVWTPPPGDPVSHHTAAYAKLLCTAVFVSGMEPSFARQTLGDNNALAAVAQRVKAGEPVIDRQRREVRVTTKESAVTRTARHFGDQGCVTLPEGEAAIRFSPKPVPRKLPDGSAAAWPLGDRLAASPPAPGLRADKLRAALDAAFAPDDALTQVFVVTWKGQLIGERYGNGANATMPLESWSMGKSIIGTLMGVLIQQGTYTLDQAAPIPEWQTSGDPRRAIRIRDILQMSSGLRIRAEQDPDYVYDGRYPDHWYYYMAPNAFAYAASRPQQWPPGTIGRYRNTDPVLASYLVRLAVEKSGEDYLTFPQRALFDRIGIRSAILEVDASGNFLSQGYDLMSGRDWARLGNLYLQDGSWAGARILPKGYAQFVSTLAPAWKADGRPIYGGFFWINGDKTFPVPEDAYYMAGAGGQYTLIIPSHDLVVVRLGRYAGARVGGESLRKSLALLMEAVPSSR
ncbi:MAG: beta-lactamase family protein [Pseudomonadota bacterium]|nr:beta-lactamase family protein [Pseudomonadota bacterium]